MERSKATRLTPLALLALAPLLFALIALLLGKEAGWDFRNYHWYNPYALLNHRLGVDLAVGHHATYYNPLIDVPVYWIGRHAPAWVAGAFLGAMFGMVVSLLGAIAYRIVAIPQPNLRLLIASTVALIGAAGGGAFSAIGSTSNDVPVAMGIFAALLMIVSQFNRLQRVELDRSLLLSMFAAGCLAGMSVGLKFTVAVYAPGLVATVFVSARGLRKRSYCTLSLCVGIAVGVALFAGYWMTRMWQFGRNPVFPYFNHLFHSPLLIEGSYRDTTYVPDDALTAWLFPFFFTADSYYVAEWPFRDAHILLAYVAIPITLAMMLFKRINTNSLVNARLALSLFVFAGASYLAWLLLFGIYRYVIPLEMLSPLLVTIAVMLWPMRPAKQLALLIALLVLSQSIVKLTLERLPWDRDYVVASVPALPNQSMVLMSGLGPLSFVIPSFPASIPFLRIDGWLVHNNDRSSGLARELHRRVESHAGPLYVLAEAHDLDIAFESAREYRLRWTGDCSKVTSNISKPLYLCRLAR